ncbi:MAG: hypothetical protein AB7O26_13275, partial [Planctomycetaceae bacterium]
MRSLQDELLRTGVTDPPLSGSWRAAPLFAKIRLVLAFLLTYTLLPYAWGRTFLMYMLDGRVEPPFAGQVALGAFLVAALTFRLGAQFPGEKFAKRTAYIVAFLWALAVGGLVVFRAGDLISPYPVAALFVLATIWLLWLAWMFFLPFRTVTRIGVLAAGLVLVVPFMMVYRVDGLTGDANVDFNYRNAPRRNEAVGAALAASTTTTARPVNLSTSTGNVFTQFQGPTRNAVLPGIKLARDWKAEPPKELWRTSVGEGWSGFAVAGEAAITQEQRGQYECVVCRNLLTGDELWVHSDATHFISTMGGNGPRGTPTIANGYVYTIGATGFFNCIDGATGKSIFTRNIQRDHEA